jgi:pantetheine-phosphate adenylyltransferase
MKKQPVYAGTFDPFTYGHLDIVERALSVFDSLVIAVAQEPNKQTLFSGADRVAIVKEAVAVHGSRVSVSAFDGLLVDYVRSIEASVIIRGLRAVADYEYEAQMALINRSLAEDIETVFLVTSAHCSFISSSFVRDVARNRGSLVKLVPASVAKRLEKLFGSSD